MVVVQQGNLVREKATVCTKDGEGKKGHLCLDSTINQ